MGSFAVERFGTSACNLDPDEIDARFNSSVLLTGMKNPGTLTTVPSASATSCGNFPCLILLLSRTAICCFYERGAHIILLGECSTRVRRATAAWHGWLPLPHILMLHFGSRWMWQERESEDRSVANRIRVQRHGNFFGSCDCHTVSRKPQRMGHSVAAWLAARYLRSSQFIYLQTRL